MGKKIIAIVMVITSALSIPSINAIETIRQQLATTETVHAHSDY